MGTNSEKSAHGDRKAFATLFDDPAIAEAAKHDPLFVGLRRYWKPLVVVAVAGWLLNAGYASYVTTQRNKLAEASQVLSDIQKLYQEVVAKQAALDGMPKWQPEEKEAYDKAQKELADLKQQAQLKIDALTSPPPFDSLARMYRGLLAAKTGDIEGVHTVFLSTSWETIAVSQTGERFAAEMGALALAKSLLSSEKYRGEAHDALIRLAERGNFAAPQAARALMVQASSADEKEAAQKIADGVLQRFPEQAKFIQGASTEDQ